MKTQEMTKEQLIAQIDVLTGNIAQLQNAEVEHKKVESALRESDDRFRFFFNNVPVGIGITSTKGNIINANRVMQNLLGYTLEEFKMMNILDTYADPDDRERLLGILHESNCIRNFETKLKHKDGTLWAVLLNADYIELDNSRVLLTSVYDISQFKQIEKELIESAERYQLLFSNAPIGITVTDFQGNLTASNQAMQELLGYTAEELTTKSALDFYFDKAERQKLLKVAEESGILRDFETTFKRKDGKPVTVLINTDLIELKDQSKVLLTSIRDISNMKHVEEQLTKERDFIDAILEVAASLVLVLDRDGLITRFNRACEETTGYSFDEVRGKHTWEFLSLNPAVSREHETVVASDYPSNHENYWRAKNGEHHLIAWSNTVLLDNEDKVEYIIATGIDITEQRQAEIGLQEANQKLATWVNELEERTSEMSQLSEMGEQLQSCQNIDEACAISAQYIQKMFSDSQGAIYLISHLKDYAEAVQMWGDSTLIEKMFVPLDCWAIRRGRPHLVDDSHPGLLCEHINGPQNGQHLCVPMMAHGETIGILYLNHIAAENHQEKATNGIYSDHKTQLVMAIAEHMALSVSSLKLRETLRQQSIRDILTGLFNRRYMEESLVRELSRAAREKKSVGIIMFDIDHFKDFNDTFGHDGGDALLRALGSFLIENTRPGDIICRYGGEEFVAVFPNATLEDSRMRAEEIRQGVKELMVLHMGEPMRKCTISLGVASFPEHGVTNDEILKNADKALYRAKNEGRDRVVVASEAIL